MYTSLFVTFQSQVDHAKRTKTNIQNTQHITIKVARCIFGMCACVSTNTLRIFLLKQIVFVLLTFVCNKGKNHLATFILLKCPCVFDACLRVTCVKNEQN